MTRKHENKSDLLEASLIDFDKTKHSLLGIRSKIRRQAFVKQIVSSLRRIEYIKALNTRAISPKRADPKSSLFDPLRAAIVLRNQGKQDEAIWLVFLATHFGKHKSDGWRLTRDVYGAFGVQSPWTWAEVTKHPKEFRTWAKKTLPNLLNDGVTRRFSNHRKYESKKFIADVVLSYVELIESYGKHRDWIVAAHKKVGQNPTAAFDFLYDDMRQVKRFGRLGIFDFLTMVGKLDLLPITPGIAYLDGATGPLRGARLLVDNNEESTSSAAKLEAILTQLDEKLEVGKQVLEDSMCNWQKSPDQYVYFRG